MGTYYTQRLREQGRWEEFQAHWARLRAAEHQRALAALLSAWDGADEDVKAEFIVARDLWPDAHGFRPLGVPGARPGPRGLVGPSRSWWTPSGAKPAPVTAPPTSANLPRQRAGLK